MEPTFGPNKSNLGENLLTNHEYINLVSRVRCWCCSGSPAVGWPPRCGKATSPEARASGEGRSSSSESKTLIGPKSMNVPMNLRTLTISPRAGGRIELPLNRTGSDGSQRFVAAINVLDRSTRLATSISRGPSPTARPFPPPRNLFPCFPLAPLSARRLRAGVGAFLSHSFDRSLRCQVGSRSCQCRPTLGC